jgi:phospholipid/cholesterol/gamma-HCH transport system substrate-binding protein
MRRNTIETVLGGVVIVVAGFFLVFAYTSADLRRVDGYEVTANFSSVGGLQSGSDVRISGVKVGTVTSQTLDPSTYLAVVHMSIDPSIKLPKDTVAVIASESLLGGKYMSLQRAAIRTRFSRAAGSTSRSPLRAWSSCWGR